MEIMKIKVIFSISVIVLVVGCINKNSSETNDINTSHEEFIENYFNFLNKGDYEKALKTWLQKNGSLDVDIEGNLKERVEIYENELGRNGENSSFIIFDIVKEALMTQV